MRLGEALASYNRAIALKPGYAEAYDNRGVMLAELMRLDEALASYERAIALKPDFAEAHSNLLFSLNYDSKLTPDRLFEAHLEWNERYGRRVPHPVAHANERDAGRRLRIGYLSPDFRSHSVAHFVEPLLKNHNRQAVEVFCYAEVIRPDAVTGHLQSFADHWRVTIGLSDNELLSLWTWQGTRGTTGFRYLPASRLRSRLRGWAIQIPRVWTRWITGWWMR